MRRLRVTKEKHTMDKILARIKEPTSWMGLALLYMAITGGGEGVMEAQEIILAIAGGLGMAMKERAS